MTQYSVVASKNIYFVPKKIPHKKLTGGKSRQARKIRCFSSLLILTLRIHQKTLQTKYFATSDSVIKILPEINTSFLLKLEPNIHQPLRKSRMSERWVINTTAASLCYFVVQISVYWHKQTSATTGSSSSSSAIFFFHTHWACVSTIHWPESGIRGRGSHGT